MLRQVSITRLVKAPQLLAARAMSGTYGDGVGKGGGTGGSIRDAGGIFGKMEAAREGEYFLKKEKEVIEQYRQGMAAEKTNNQQKLADLSAAQNMSSNQQSRSL